MERSAEVLHAWRSWIRTVPDEVTSVGRILQFPPIDEVPEPMRGRSFAIVHAYSLGTEAEGIERLAALRALGPEIDTVRMVPPVELSEMHMDPPDPLPYFGEHLVLRDVPAAAIDDFVAAAGPGSGSTLASVEIRHAGGALGRGGKGHGALDKLPGEFVYFGIGMASTSSRTRRHAATCTGSRAAFGPTGRGATSTSRRRRPTPRASTGTRRTGGSARSRPTSTPTSCSSRTTRSRPRIGRDQGSRTASRRPGVRPAVRGGLRATNVLHRRKERDMTTAVLETGVTTARRSWSGLLAPFGGLGLIAGLITIFLSPAGDETGDTPAEVVAWATTHRTWNVALLLFAVASIGLGGMFVAGLHARLRAVATDTESALVLIGGTAFMLCFAFCWISWLGPLDGIAADEELALAQASAYLAYDDVGWFFLGSAGVGAALMAVPASLAAMRAGVPSWLGWLGVVAGLLSAATIVFFGIFGWMAWIAVASVVLLVARR